MAIPIELVVDVSGTPGNTTHFGMVSFNRHTKDSILNEFFDHHPHLRRAKGRSLKLQDCLKVIDALNQNDVRMVSMRFTANDWSYHRNQWRGRHEIDERICAAIYYNMARVVCRSNCRYDLTSCVESQLGDIKRVFHHCKRLAALRNIEFEFYQSTDSMNRSIRIADFIAYSGRVLRPLDVGPFKHYKILTAPSTLERNMRFLFS